MKQAIPVAVVMRALGLLSVFDRPALRGLSRALYYENAHNPVGTGGRRPSPREEPATAALPSVLVEDRKKFWVEEQGSVPATLALPNNLIVAAVWLAWMDARKLHGEVVPALPDSIWILLCSAVASHREGVSLRRPHAKWVRELTHSWKRRGASDPLSTTDVNKGGWWSWCQQAAISMGWTVPTTVAGYEKTVRPMVAIRTGRE